jgi:hypothetical protein
MDPAIRPGRTALADFGAGAGVVDGVVLGRGAGLPVRAEPGRLVFFFGRLDAFFGGLLGFTEDAEVLGFVVFGLPELAGGDLDAGGSAPRVHTPTSVARSIRARVRGKYMGGSPSRYSRDSDLPAESSFAPRKYVLSRCERRH